MRRRVMLCFSLLGVCLMLFYLLAEPAAARDAAAAGLSLCARVIVPSLFPFFVLSNFICLAGLTVRLEGGALALFLGLLGGYPVGAQTVCTQYSQGTLSRKESERLLFFCNNAGPAFIFGVVGYAVFGNTRAGVLLYAVHALSALTLCALSGGLRTHRNTGQHAPGLPFAQAFTQSVSQAGGLILSVCAFITFFSILLCAIQVLIAQIFFLPAALRPVVFGIVELANGIWALREAPLSMPWKLSTASFLLGFGGLCVHFQTICALQKAGLGLNQYFFGKLLHAVISAAMTLALSPLISEQVIPAFAASSQVYAPVIVPFFTLCVLIFLAFLFFESGFFRATVLSWRRHGRE